MVPAARTRVPSVSAQEITQVSGKVAAEPSEPQPPPEQANLPVPHSTRAVARAALKVAASIRGGGVYGSGIAISDHHVLTCLHVVDKMKAIQLSVADGPFRTARIVDQDRRLDLAILHVEQPNADFARISSASTMEMGDAVFAMGNPRKMSLSLASGIVSYAGRPYGNIYYLQTDVPMNGGSSGGPVLDESGGVVAVSSFILRNSQGLAFALPIDYAYARFRQYFTDRMSLSNFESWLSQRGAPSDAAVAMTAGQ